MRCDPPVLDVHVWQTRLRVAVHSETSRESNRPRVTRIPVRRQRVIAHRTPRPSSQQRPITTSSTMEVWSRRMSAIDESNGEHLYIDSIADDAAICGEVGKALPDLEGPVCRKCTDRLRVVATILAIESKKHEADVAHAVALERERVAAWHDARALAFWKQAERFPATKQWALPNATVHEQSAQAIRNGDHWKDGA